MTTYTYDNDGNQRSVETPTNDLTTLTWSYESKLVQIEQPLANAPNFRFRYTSAPRGFYGRPLRESRHT